MKQAKIYLWNSMMGQVYSASDSFLDNGLAYLQAACEAKGVDVELDDPANMDFMTGFVQSIPGVRSLSAKLSLLAPRVFRSNPDAGDMRSWYALQEEASQIIAGKMEEYLLDLALKIQKGRYHILGIKTWLGKRHIYSERLAALVQEHAPETIIISGGPQMNQFQEDCLTDNQFDLGVYSEGEKALVRVAEIAADKRAQGWKKGQILSFIASMADRDLIPNLVYRKDGAILKTSAKFASLDDLPLPLYSCGEGKVNVGVVVDDLGCYYKKGCAFCAHKTSLGGYRPRKIIRTMAEIEHLITQDIGLFRFSSSATPANKGYKIALKALSRGVNMEFSMFTRGEHSAIKRYPELVHKYQVMAKAGLRAVFLGVEAANQRVLDEIVEKGNTVDDLFYTVAAIKEASRLEKTHVDVGLSFIHPVPLPKGLGAEEIMHDNLEFLQKLEERNCRVDSVLVTPAGPLPGARWFEEQVRYGFDLPEDFLPTYMRYNFELGKDPKTWPDIGINLNGRSFKEMLEEAGRFSQILADKGYAVNLTDEHCLCARACGFEGHEGLLEFKQKSDQAILCLDYAFLNKMAGIINKHSRLIARKNAFHPLNMRSAGLEAQKRKAVHG
ncbi:B12-binding domain-containing radical SAM protein [Desulfatibacillum aliphaticivorans]|uniref:B12-binding domain-containing radical SAM protein n=1 Tax=Desulfatibacillum aliphaticivorans TaxID=218208 RepID=UPI000422B432|nr:B12-binding domain-containing radical SAM protein [Desulfatibacillum aliphaticivorans]